MASRTLPGLGLAGFWDLGASDWKPGMDSNLQKLSALVQMAVLSRTIDLPTTPVDGNMFIVKDTATANANDIAIRDNGEWVYVTPHEGWQAYIIDTEELSIFDGIDWIPFSGGASSLGELTDVDLTSTTPVNRQVLMWNAALSKWMPDEGLVAIAPKTATYTLVLADAQKCIRMNVGTDNSLTVPTEATVAFPVGTSILVSQAGIGKTTFIADVGVTINTPETLKLRKQHSGATLLKVASNEWDLVGDLELLV